MRPILATWSVWIPTAGLNVGAPLTFVKLAGSVLGPHVVRWKPWPRCLEPALGDTVWVAPCRWVWGELLPLLRVKVDEVPEVPGHFGTQQIPDHVSERDRVALWWAWLYVLEPFGVVLSLFPQ